MIKLNGTSIECVRRISGKLIHIMLPLDECPIQLFRSDKCEVEFDGEIFKCSVNDSYIKAKYGQPKLRVMILRVDSRFKKAVEQKPIQKVIKPAVTKVVCEDKEVKEKPKKKSKPKLKKISKKKDK